MERRTFLAMVSGSSLLAAPLAAEAQPAKVARIGYLSPHPVGVQQSAEALGDRWFWLERLTSWSWGYGS